MNWDSKEINDLIDRALQEDVGSGDITTVTLVPKSLRSSAVYVAKQSGVLAGLPLIPRIFRKLDPDIQVDELMKDGDLFEINAQLCRISGETSAILTGERVSLNLLQRLCGIASKTAQYVKLARPFGIKILDTRKTTPLLRSLEKYAVTAGGGTNHRIGLFDAVMVKDNHLKIQPDFREVLHRFERAGFPADKVEIEVETPSMLRNAIESGARWFLLDNMSPEQIKECVKLKKVGMFYEVSGGIGEKNFSDYLIPGVDAISIGGLTHSVESTDISMEID